MDDGDGSTLLAGTAGTTASVGIALDVIRQTIVDDVSQILHIQATSCHVGSHKELYGVLTELLHGKVTLLLTQVAMKSLSIVTILDELVGDVLCLQLGAAEDNRKDAWIIIDDAL